MVMLLLLVCCLPLAHSKATPYFRQQQMTLPTFDVVSAKAGEALRKDGLVLLRGQSFTVEDFKRVAMKAWNAAGYDYGLGDYNKGGSVQRAALEGNVYDVAAGAPAEKPVSGHCEKSYMHKIPHFVAFACFKAAEEGGELELRDMTKVLKFLSPGFLAKLKTRGLEYSRRYGDEDLSPWWSYPTGFWQKRFNTDDWSVAQDLARNDMELGGPNGTRLRRDANGTALLQWRASALALSPGGIESLVSGIFDNHPSANYTVGLTPFDCRFGDGTEFSEEEMADLRTADEEAVAVIVKLQPGDVIVVDNFRYSHGRRPFAGVRQHVSLLSDPVPRGMKPPLPFKHDDL